MASSASKVLNRAASSTQTSNAGVFRTNTNFARMVEGINRSRLGRFVDGGLQPIIDAHREMALDASKVIAEVLKERIAEHGREQRPTNYLLEALVNPEYQTANRDGFVIGGLELERSPAREYFRALEGGSDKFVGRTIAGFFKNSGGGITGPGSNRTDVQLIQLNRSFGDRPGNVGTADNPLPISALINQRTGKARVRSKGSSEGERNFSDVEVPGVGRGSRQTVRSITTGGGAESPNNFGYRIVIKNPIPAYEYFLVGGTKWLASGARDEIYRRLLAGIPGVTVNGQAV